MYRVISLPRLKTRHVLLTGTVHFFEEHKISQQRIFGAIGHLIHKKLWQWWVKTAALSLDCFFFSNELDDILLCKLSWRDSWIYFIFEETRRMWYNMLDYLNIRQTLTVHLSRDWWDSSCRSMFQAFSLVTSSFRSPQVFPMAQLSDIGPIH